MNGFILLKTALDELYVKGNADAVEKLFSENYSVHAAGRTHSGRKFIMQYMKSLRKSVSGIKVLKTELLSENGNLISWKRTLSGIHQAGFRGIPASGKRIKWEEMMVSRIEDALIAEEWLSSDLAFQLMLKNREEF